MIESVESTETYVFLDFDGVLAIPYSNPVELYPQIPDVLAKLREKATLCLASFNPTAIKELRRLGVLHHFTACRAGSHLNEEIIEWRESLGTLCKYAQIESMHKQLGIKSEKVQVYFFDDDPLNIHTVSRNSSDIVPILVNNKKGLTHGTVSFITEYTPPFSSS